MSCVRCGASLDLDQRTFCRGCAVTLRRISRIMAARRRLRRGQKPHWRDGWWGDGRVFPGWDDGVG